MGVTPLATAAGQVSASTILLFPGHAARRSPVGSRRARTPQLYSPCSGLGLLSTALAYVLYFRILATAGATNVLLVTLLVPVSAILLGALVLGERLAPRHILGMALIGLGLDVHRRPAAAVDQRNTRIYVDI